MDRQLSQKESIARAQQAQDDSRRRREMARAASSLKSSSKGGSKSGGARIPRAPKSASKFYHNAKFSKKSGKSGRQRAPKSAVGKIRYDFEMDLKEGQQSRLDYAYVAAPEGTPKAALDAVRMAEASEQSLSKFANRNAAIMAHAEISLPKELSTEQRHQLIRDIGQHYQKELGVPVYMAAHLPDNGNYGNRNFHVHLSYPIRHVLPDGENGFALGKRLIQYARPDERAAAGLPKTGHDDLRNMRAAIGNLIGDSMKQAGCEVHLSERWRHGHLRLPEQVNKAIERGDVAFVQENFGRDTTRKEGLNAERWRDAPNSEQRQSAQEHNEAVSKGLAIAQPTTRALLNRVMELAERAKLNQPEHIRMLARDMGLSIEWTRAKGKQAVSGMRLAMTGAPKLSGREVGFTLHDLKRRFKWDEMPAYSRYAPKTGRVYDQYAQALKQANIGVVAGQAQNNTERAIIATQKLADRAIQQAQANIQTPAAQRPQTAQAARLLVTQQQVSHLTEVSPMNTSPLPSVPRMARYQQTDPQQHLQEQERRRKLMQQEEQREHERKKKLKQQDDARRQQDGQGKSLADLSKEIAHMNPEQRQAMIAQLPPAERFKAVLALNEHGRAQQQGTQAGGAQRPDAQVQQMQAGALNGRSAELLQNLSPDDRKRLQAQNQGAAGQNDLQSQLDGLRSNRQVAGMGSARPANTPMQSNHDQQRPQIERPKF